MNLLREHQQLLQQIGLFGMAGITIAEIVLRSVLRLMYTSLIKASGDPDRSPNKLMKKIREETRVQNVDTFVEKCLLTHKVAGLQLWNTERICRFLTCFFFIFGSTTVVLGICLEFGQTYLLSTLSTMILLGELLIIMGIQSAIPYQKDMIYVNLKDYAERKWQSPEREERETPAPAREEMPAVPPRARSLSGMSMNAGERQLVLDVLTEYMAEKTRGAVRDTVPEEATESC